MKLRQHDRSDHGDSHGGVASPAPGRATPTSRLAPHGLVAPVQLAPVSAPSAAHEDPFAMHLIGLTAPGTEAAELVASISEMVDAKVACENILRHFRSGLLQHDAASLITRVVDEQAVPATRKLVGFHREGAARARRAESNNLWTRTAALNEQAEQDDVAVRLEALMPTALDALTNIARCVIEIAGAGSGTDPRDVGSTPALVTLAEVAKPLGWKAPADLHEAQARRRAFEACPAGAREEFPETCDLSDAERARYVAEVGFRLLDAADAFYDVAGGFSAELERAIEADAAAAAALNGVLADGLQTLALAVGPEGPIAGAVASYVWDLNKSVIDAAASAPIDPRNQTVDMLEALQHAAKDRLRATREGARALNDKELRQLSTSLAGADQKFFRPRVAAFVARYRAQIEPIGRPMSAHIIPDFDRSHLVQKVVWLERSSGKKRLALVGHAPASGVLLEEYRFIRWIDDDLAGLAGAETAPAVPAHQVIGYPVISQ